MKCKNILLTVLFSGIFSGAFFSLNMMGMDNSIPVIVEVSVECAKNMKNINKDGGGLYLFFKGVFSKIGENPEEYKTKPSDLIKIFANENGKEGKKLNSAEGLCGLYEEATWYLQKIVLPVSGELDKAFEEKLAALNNWKEAWLWFDGFFKQKGLNEPFKKYKKQLIELDQNMW